MVLFITKRKLPLLYQPGRSVMHKCSLWLLFLGLKRHLCSLFGIQLKWFWRCNDLVVCCNLNWTLWQFFFFFFTIMLSSLATHENKVKKIHKLSVRISEWMNEWIIHWINSNDSQLQNHNSTENNAIMQTYFWVKQYIRQDQIASFFFFFEIQDYEVPLYIRCL